MYCNVCMCIASTGCMCYMLCHMCSVCYVLWKVKVLVVQPCLTFLDPMDCSLQAPLSTEFSRQEYRIRLPFPSPKDLPSPGTEPRTEPIAGGSFTIWATREAQHMTYIAMYVSCHNIAHCVTSYMLHAMHYMLLHVLCVCYTYTHTELHVMYDYSMCCMWHAFLASVGV